MYEILNNSIVKVSKIQTKKQLAIIKELYCQRYEIGLSYQEGIVTATMFENQITNENTVVERDIASGYDGIIVFDLSGQQIETQAFSGVAQIEFVSEIAGEYKIRTVNECVKNGEVIIHV